MPSVIVQCFNMLLLIMLSVIWQIVIILSFIMLSDIMLCALIPSDSMLCGIERSVIVGVPVMCGIALSGIGNAQCHFTKCTFILNVNA
jgi:hypothetical protein